MGIGLDVGTNMLVSAMLDDRGAPIYRKQRNAFYRITPKSLVNSKNIKASLERRQANFIIDGDDFVVVGEDALVIANERGGISQRPMSKGVLSPKEKNAIPIIKLLIKNLLSGYDKENTICFSVPAEPVDNSFDIFFHTEIIKEQLKDIGVNILTLNEAFAVAFSELVDDDLTGVCISLGAGMSNVSVCYEGEEVHTFSLTKGGDWIDSSAATAINETSSIIQVEKEQGDLDILNPKGKIHEAISVYYKVLLNYIVDNLVKELSNVKLPNFREPLPIIISGGLSLANNTINLFNNVLSGKRLPFEVKEVKRAKDPITSVANGCLMASIL